MHALSLLLGADQLKMARACGRAMEYMKNDRRAC